MRIATRIYRELLDVDKILELHGQIKFFLGDVSIIVRQKDVVGSIIQEWLQGWFDSRSIKYLPSQNTQMPPDFFLNLEDRTQDLLEVKVFNIESNPGFDIADFHMFIEEIVEKPYMLYADYLIFGYDMREDGFVRIKKLWLKKVWEITRRMENWTLNLQIKRGMIHKIRPGVWYSNRNRTIPMFQSLEHFISAIVAVIAHEGNTDAQDWQRQFIKSYELFYGTRFQIPKWDDIAQFY